MMVETAKTTDHASWPGETDSDLLAREMDRVLRLIQQIAKQCTHVERRRVPKTTSEAAELVSKASAALRHAADLVRDANSEPTAVAWAAVSMASMLAGAAAGLMLAHEIKARGSGQRNEKSTRRRKEILDELAVTAVTSKTIIEVAKQVGIEPASVKRAVARRRRTQ